MGVLLAGIERPRDEAAEALRSKVYSEQGQISESPQLPTALERIEVTGDAETREKAKKKNGKTYPGRLCRSGEHFGRFKQRGRITNHQKGEGGWEKGNENGKKRLRMGSASEFWLAPARSYL